MSVGHVARLAEAEGVPTVIVAVNAFGPVLRGMTVPRLLLTPHFMGRPLGPPGDRGRQRAVVLAALELLETATAPGTAVELGDGPSRDARSS